MYSLQKEKMIQALVYSKPNYCGLVKYIYRLHLVRGHQNRAINEMWHEGDEPATLCVV